MLMNAANHYCLLLAGKEIIIVIAAKALVVWDDTEGNVRDPGRGWQQIFFDNSVAGNNSTRHGKNKYILHTTYQNVVFLPIKTHFIRN